MRSQQLDNVLSLRWVLYVVSGCKHALSRDNYRTCFLGATSNATYHLNCGLETRLATRQLLHPANSWSIFEQQQFAKVVYLDSDTYTELDSFLI